MMVLKLLKLVFSLLLLAAVTNGELEALKAKIMEIIQIGGQIDGQFKPLKYIDDGGFSVVYRGERSSDKFSIAMKFSPWEHKSVMDREFEMYTYLHAVNKTNVEQYGISPILYYKKLQWEDDEYMLAVFSFFDGGHLLDMSKKGHFSHAANDPNVINSLIIFRDFIRQSKYLHSCGVRHDDIKPENIMFRKHRSFLIDFNLSSKMKEKAGGNTLEYASRRCHSDFEMYPLDDFESFLYSMAFVNGIELEWFKDAIYEKLNELASFKLAGEIKKNVTKIETIFKTIKSPPLRTVYSEFVKEVFGLTAHSTPNYDHLYSVINAQIKNILQPNETAVFTWLSNAEKKNAIKDITDHPLPEISKLTVPGDFTKFKYPPVNYNYFCNKPTTKGKTSGKKKTKASKSGRK